MSTNNSYTKKKILAKKEAISRDFEKCLNDCWSQSRKEVWCQNIYQMCSSLREECLMYLQMLDSGDEEVIKAGDYCLEIMLSTHLEIRHLNKLFDQAGDN